MAFPAAVKINYTNYRGETADRIILPRRMYFGWTEWHPTPQWLLTALDLERDVIRDFAMSQIHSWEVA